MLPVFSPFHSSIFPPAFLFRRSILPAAVIFASSPHSIFSCFATTTSWTTFQPPDFAPPTCTAVLRKYLLLIFIASVDLGLPLPDFGCVASVDLGLALPHFESLQLYYRFIYSYSLSLLFY
ncbi:hypothetical protein KSP39_PZI021962 [Platanthera zijinensis]|uniref:Uncharacterized protein n=1 Tax=Platanthera zijinensis TaxID=2320716 RepID=A0AAP0FVW4_9ASPA